MARACGAHPADEAKAVRPPLTVAAPDERVICARAMKKLRVCQMVTSLVVGGAERVALDLAVRADRDRFETTLATVRGGGPFADVARKAGVPVEVFDVRGVRAPLELARLVAWLHGRFDVVHAHPGTVARYAARIAGIPAVVSTLHNIYSWKRPLWRESDRLLALRFTDRNVAVAEEVRRSALDFYDLPETSIETIPNGIDLEQFRPPLAGEREAARAALGLDDRFWFAAAGRLTNVKRFDVLLRALAKRREAGSAAGLVLAGDGPERAALEALGAQLGLVRSGQLRMLGRRDDLPRVLHASDAFVHAADREGFGLVLAEAMATRLPVAAAAAGGVLTVVEDEVTGLLLPIGDVDAAAGAMKRLEEDAALRNALGVAGRRRCEARFSIRDTVRAYERVWMEAFDAAG